MLIKDSGVDVEDNKKENDLAKSKSEKDIKHKILNILNDVKAQEESKKKTRNFGRNFEFQMPNLKPVIANDKRYIDTSFNFTVYKLKLFVMSFSKILCFYLF